MSHSPIEQTSGISDNYRRGWEALFKLLYSGGSFSGRERNCCFLNTRGTEFADISAAAGFDYADDGRALGLVDWDQDGAMDCWLVNRSAPRARFLHNRVDPGKRFLALKLEGKTCNRDAIGARVTITTNGEPSMQIRTLRAGEGYLAQSSKWLHFGLGDVDEVLSVAVEWPGDEAEVFTELKPGTRYRLTQGSGKPQPWRRPEADDSLAALPYDVPAVSEKARIMLAERVPLPPLPYIDDEGHPQQLVPNGTPLLVNLWASWCQPCLKELSEFRDWTSKTHPDLRILPISVDEPSAQGDAKAALQRLKWMAGAGYATDELVNILETIQQSLLSHKQPLPVPSSFLVDQQGRLATIYKGAISIEQLQEDLRLMEADDETIWGESIPFAGWWHERPSALGHSQLAISRGFIKDGNVTLGEAYLNAIAADVDPDQLAPDAEARASIAGVQVNLAAQQFDRGQAAAAMTSLKNALRFRPAYAKAHHNLAVIYESRGELDMAAEHYASAIDAQPDHAESHFNLGLILLSEQNPDEAVTHFRARRTGQARVRRRTL